KESSPNSEGIRVKTPGLPETNHTAVWKFHTPCGNHMPCGNSTRRVETTCRVEIPHAVWKLPSEDPRTSR
ncbi:hypothetical protein LINGRAHAP2_LOCUS1930, partial [Linum grandiflorum]